MMGTAYKLLGVLIVAGAATAGCTSILGDFTTGGGNDASVDGQGNSSGGNVTHDAGTDSTTVADTGPGTEDAGDAGSDAPSTCTPGTPCSPGACVSGITLCEGGVPTCVVEGTAFNGTSCDAGAVCSNGSCIGCQVGASCAEAGSCQMATIACSTGSPTCLAGGNAPNGQSCGTDLYCNSGTCAACTAGAPCEPPANPCHLGKALCVNGGISCQDTDASAPPGTSCGTNQVCDNTGTCTNCTANAACNPGGNLCQSGMTSCATGETVCTNATNVQNGAPCGTNMVCSGGTCTACQSGASCSPNNNSCLIGYIDCSSGSPVCTQSGVAQNGTACGSGQVCNNGQCGACTANAACNPNGNVCQTGTTSCSTGTSTCTSATNVADGTACGTNEVCMGGACVACTANVACNPGGNVCLAGKTSCATGTSVCVSSGPAGNGITCGTNEVCNNGSCVACTAGASCNPTNNPCQTGTTSCNTGTQTCQLTNVMDGTSCGTNEVCSGGSCVACTSGQSCPSPGNPCQLGTTSCTTGTMTCGGTLTNAAPGVSCGTNMVCNGNGSCVACTAGLTCSPSACQTGMTSCQTGASACTASITDLKPGTSCGTNMVCNSSASCVACTSGTACSINSCTSGQTSCTTGASECTADITYAAPGTTCGTNEVCNGTGSCVACTAGGACTANGGCETGTYSCATGTQVCSNLTAAKDGTACGTNMVCLSGACNGCVLTLDNTTVGSGELYTSDQKLACGGTCSAIYTCGTSVTVNPSSDAYLESDLTGACSAYGSCTFTITSNETVSATWLTEYWDSSYGSATISGTTVTIPSTAVATTARSYYQMYDYGGTADPEKVYWEIYVDESGPSTSDCGAVGIQEASVTASSDYLGYTANALGFGYGCCAGVYNGFSNVTINVQTPASYGLAAGNTYMFALDMAKGYLWVGLNGSWLSGNPATETSPFAQGAGLTGGTTYANTGANLHAAVFGYGSSEAACTVQFTGHFSSSTYTYAPPFGF